MKLHPIYMSTRASYGLLSIHTVYGLSLSFELSSLDFSGVGGRKSNDFFPLTRRVLVDASNPTQKTLRRIARSGSGGRQLSTTLAPRECTFCCRGLSSHAGVEQVRRYPGPWDGASRALKLTSLGCVSSNTKLSTCFAGGLLTRTAKPVSILCLNSVFRA